MKKIIFYLGIAIILIIGIIFYTKNKSSITNQSSKTGLPQLPKSNQVSLPTEKPISSGIDLDIYEPKSNSIVNSPMIKVKGKTAPLAEVYINDKETKANMQGDFSLDYILDEGENILTIMANDEYGNYAEKEVVVTLESLK
ncbi:MAG: hypothetical protein ACPL1D_02430 [Microgenomates group bacterium]